MTRFEQNKTVAKRCLVGFATVLQGEFGATLSLDNLIAAEIALSSLEQEMRSRIIAEFPSPDEALSWLEGEIEALR